MKNQRLIIKQIVFIESAGLYSNNFLLPDFHDNQQDDFP